MSKDKYCSFDELFKGEPIENYKIVAVDRESTILIMAPHGGKIELGTSEIARSVARDDLSFYCFEGRRKTGNRELHITSHKYDEPSALDLVGKCEVVIAIHGRADDTDPATVWVGGLHENLHARLVDELKQAGFAAKINLEQLAGTDPGNICNCGSARKGAQLEVPKALRDKLISDVTIGHLDF